MFSGVNLDKFLQGRYKSIWLMKLKQVKGRENPKKIPATESKFLTLSYSGVNAPSDRGCYVSHVGWLKKTGLLHMRLWSIHPNKMAAKLSKRFGNVCWEI